MNIFIKSFNRPYYLQRCIQSILNNVEDANLIITVLDDGTHPAYLDKLKNIYPQINIQLSPFYEEKVHKIERFLNEGVEINKMEIPTQFWLSNIIDCSEQHFLLLEDDIWFSNKINVDEVITLMKFQNMCMLKLFHFNNSRLVSGKHIPINEEIYEIKPKLITTNPFLFENLLVKNFFKIMSVLKKAGLYNPKNFINYYTIYNVAGVLFSKEYYEYLWKDFSGMVDENKQLIKAVKFFNIQKPNSYGAYNYDILNTSFSSSATNMFKDINFNVFIYNGILNKAWFNGKLDVMSGYPGDISEVIIEELLKRENHPLASVNEWRKWVNRFKEQYRAVGHRIS